MNVMLLAAGEGTRLLPYTNILPKPAIPFLTVPLAGHALSFLQELDLNKLVVNTYHLAPKIHELFHRLSHGARSVHFSDEQGDILGSGGGLGNARKHFLGGGDFIMMNADEVILPKDSDVLTKAVAYHRKSKALATLLVIDHPGVGTQFGGVWTDENNRVQGFGKSAVNDSTKAWHFVGVQILSENIFAYIPSAGASNILYDAVTTGITQGECVQVFPFECSWFETGNIKDLLEASEQCLKFLADPKDTFQKRALEKTLNHFSDSKPLITHKNDLHSMCAKNALVSSSAKISGLFIAAENSSVADHCRLKNVIVGSGVAIPANTEASDCMFI